MKFVSTRGQTEPHSFSEAVRIGLAPDKGLFVPEELPDLGQEMLSWQGKTYPELCYEFFKHFATDIPSDELKALVETAYSRFDHPDHAPLVKLSDKLYVLELFHGPTLAFKDFALQLLGCLYERQVAQSGQGINVLGATSGDTGAAAINGLLGKKGVNIFILYPDGRVSPLQERQMTCLEEENVFPLAIKGSFDDAQAALKEVFGDKDFSREVHLSAVNSINLARILAQCVYYIYAWLKLPAESRDRATFVVPTGNFGNVLAGWLASRMGMVVDGFRVATNQNDILHRFFSAGDYSLGAVQPSHAPSMDIQVASNFERFLYFSLGGNAEMTREIMEGFKKDGAFQVGGMAITEFMTSSRMDDAEIAETITRVYKEFGYVSDPHTACGFKDIDHLEPAIVLSTAHPAKFPDVVEACTGISPTHASLEALKAKDVQKYSVEPTEQAIKAFIRNHQA
ncbi:threonine synthase [Pelagicoccus sp. SDUM812003]|uniref:threonine synthase n=1 Tax=Pelagicoccus sp. SDUM812003 TaxID=3041267 RepID=UPI00280F68AB|nr:threonine synthase [Pelagicoccus sp. SDUM812003]MDQ8204460.1 threonine synthase [Pelagicoccus sp. SDUM812003]